MCFDKHDKHDSNRVNHLNMILFEKYNGKEKSINSGFGVLNKINMVLFEKI